MERGGVIFGDDFFDAGLKAVSQKLILWEFKKY
jgi:hypothetical protein